MSKELEDLLRRVTELEKKLGKSNLFGANQNTIGSTSADLTLKTSGKVKIQWGNKFIDLIKDGKINVDSKFIYVRDDIGTKDGIYVSTDKNTVVLKVGNSQINLIGETGSTYVSFLGKQITTPEQKYQALTNIGFIYPSLDDLDNSSLQNGVIYIEEEQKLYFVKDGELTEFEMNIPTPYTQQLILAKNDAKLGSIFIQGNGIENSLAFDTLYIYTQGQSSYFQTSDGIIFVVNNSQILSIDTSQIVSNRTIVSNRFQSSQATGSSGFRLYLEGNTSTLEIDNLMVRNGFHILPNLYPEYWWGNNNIITSIESGESSYDITLKYPQSYKEGDQLYVYVDSTEDADTREAITQSIVVLTIVDVYDSQHITVTSTIDDYSTLNNKLVFLIRTDKIIKNSNRGFDLLSEQVVKTRVGDLEELNLTIKENGVTIPISNLLGIYSDNGVFASAQYVSSYNLPDNDNSTKFASTEWVNRKLIPKGTILMFNNSVSEIPEGWHICDGTNDTPNLSGYFIKGGETSGNIEDYKVLSGEDTSEGSQITQFQSYSMVFIMKII